MSVARIVAHLADIPPGEGRNVDIDGRRIAVFRLRDGQVFATRADCPHLGGPLADGLVGTGTVMCPLHDRVFDLATGDGVGNDCRIEVFPAIVQHDGAITVLLEG